MNDRLVLCLGNDLLTDDGLGFVVASELGSNQKELDADICAASLSGFSFLDLLTDRREVLVVDAIVTGSAPPGTIHQFLAHRLAPTWNLIGSHHINLPTTIEMGRELGMIMPERVDVIAVEAADVQTLHQGLTPAVQRQVPEIVSMVQRWIGDRARASSDANKSSAAVRPVADRQNANSPG